jgi:hypothetical protein
MDRHDWWPQRIGVSDGIWRLMLALLCAASAVTLVELTSSHAAAQEGAAPSGISSGFSFRAGGEPQHNWLGDLVVLRGASDDHQHVEVPEPLLFDLVRPLGARQGELEFNTLAVFPWAASNRNLDDDPFGSGPTSPDRGGIEWAPEVEYAIVDNLAIEFEFPFESSTLEEYKLGLQWTIGTAFENHYIHGFQMLVEPTTAWTNWNTTLLYLAGIRFDETWSALLMFGGRMDLEGPGNSQTFERLINASLFADVCESAKMGIETNYASSLDGSSQFIVVPQVHYGVTDHVEVQSGLGLGVFTEGFEQSFILRLIYSR